MMKFLRGLGWFFVPYIMIFFRWKTLGKVGKTFGTVWALLGLLFLSGFHKADPNTQSKPAVAPVKQQEQQKQTEDTKKLQDEAKKKEAADAKAKADEEAKAKDAADAKSKADGEVKKQSEQQQKEQTQVATQLAPAAPAQNSDGNVEFLNAVNSIAYNTFVEAGNLGDQMKQAGAMKISAGDFADFMDTDLWLWNQYVKNIDATKPTDEMLILERQNILDDLNRLKNDSEDLKKGAEKSKPDEVLNFTGDMSKTSQDMILTLNKLKQHYKEALSPANTDKFGVKPNWIPQ